MKITRIVTASIAVLILGGKLVLAAFASVLPPDFDRKWDEGFATAYWWADYRSHEQAMFYAETGRWATSVEDLFVNGPQSDRYRQWKERNESSFGRQVHEMSELMQFIAVDETESTIRYRSSPRIEGRPQPTNDAVCSVTLDASYARALQIWYDTPGARASSQLPEELERWARMDCRRTSGLRAWLSWAGLDRYREPPPEQYSAMAYAEEAWERESAEPPAPVNGERD